MAAQIPKSKKPVRKRVDTPTKLILSAEKLFGEYGIDAVTLRMVCDDADQKNKNSIQYHFGDRAGLLNAIFEFREHQLQPRRRQMLDYAEEHRRWGDVRYLLRICFEPTFLMYRDDGEMGYIKLHAAYLATHRPRGVLHPTDWESESTVSFRKGIAHLRHRLDYLGEPRFQIRFEAVGAMFLSGLIQHAVRLPEQNILLDAFYEDMLDMMVLAISAPPCPVDMIEGLH